MAETKCITIHILVFLSKPLTTTIKTYYLAKLLDSKQEALTPTNKALGIEDQLKLLIFNQHCTCR